MDNSFSEFMLGMLCHKKFNVGALSAPTLTKDMMEAVLWMWKIKTRIAYFFSASGDGNRTGECLEYRVSTNTWWINGQCKFKNRGSKAVIMDDGDIMVIGGKNERSHNTKLCMVYSRAAKKWTWHTLLNTERWSHSAVVLRDGTIMVAGGETQEYFYIDSIEYFVDKQWQLSETTRLPVQIRGHCAVVLADGRVLFSGGYGTRLSNDSGIHRITEDCWLYDHDTRTFTAAAPMNIGRVNHAMILMPDNTVLVTGGKAYPPVNISLFPVATSSCEIYYPADNKWVLMEHDMKMNRLGHACILGEDGVIAIGGMNSTFWSERFMEIFKYADHTWHPLSVGRSAAAIQPLDYAACC